MNNKRLSAFGLAIATFFTVGVVAATSALNSSALNIIGTHAELQEYVTLNGQNSPTESSSFVEVNSHEVSTRGVYFYYSSVRAAQNAHCELEEGGYIEKVDAVDASSKDLRRIFASFDGRLKIMASYDALTLDNAPIEFELTSGESFNLGGNFFRIVALENTVITSLGLSYVCDTAAELPDDSENSATATAAKLMVEGSELRLHVSGTYTGNVQTLASNNFKTGTSNLEINDDTNEFKNGHGGGNRTISLSKLDPKKVSVTTTTFEYSYNITDVMQVAWNTHTSVNNVNSWTPKYVFLRFNGTRQGITPTEETVELTSNLKYKMRKNSSNYVAIENISDAYNQTHSMQSVTLEDDGRLKVSSTYSESLDALEVFPNIDFQVLNGSWGQYCPVFDMGYEKVIDTTNKKCDLYLNVKEMTDAAGFDQTLFMHFNPKTTTDASKYATLSMTSLGSETFKYNVVPTEDNHVLQIGTTRDITRVNPDSWAAYLVCVRKNWGAYYGGASNIAIGLDNAIFEGDTGRTYNKVTFDTGSEIKIKDLKDGTHIKFKFYSNADYENKKVGLKMTWDRVWWNADLKIFTTYLNGTNLGTTTANYNTDGNQSWETGYVYHGEEGNIKKGWNEIDFVMMSVASAGGVPLSVVSAYADI